MKAARTGGVPEPSGTEPARTRGTRNNASSLRRALALVEFLAQGHERPVGLQELSAAAGAHKSTVLRLVAPLIEAGLLQRTGPADYALGPTTIRWGQAYLAGLDLRATARPVLLGLSQETKETIHLVVYDPPEVIYVEKIDSPRAVRMHSRVGDRQPIYCTAVGKAFLAQLPSEAVTAALTGPMTPRTPHTIIDEAALRKEIAHVTKRGFAIDDQENELEIRCVGAVVLNHVGAPAAGVSVSAPASRMPMARATNLGPVVTAAAAKISALLGNPGTASAGRGHKLGDAAKR